MKDNKSLEGWKEVILDDIYEIKQGKHLSLNNLLNEGYAVYGANGRVGYYNDYMYKDPTLLITCRGATCGSINLTEPKSWVTGNSIALIPKEKIDVNFMRCLLTYTSFNDVISGSAQPQIIATTLRKKKIAIPSLETQKKIAEVLEKAEKVIEKRKETIKLLDELVKSRFIEMFGDPVTNSKGWNVEVLEKYIDVIGGYAFKSTEFINEGIPVLKIGNINAGYFKSTNLMFWKRDEKLNKYLIKPKDLVISLTGTVGKDDYGNVCIMSDEYEEYYLNQRNAKLEIKSKSLLNKYYLTYLLKVPEVKKRLTGINRGVRQANIANKDILNLEVPLPPIELQNQFADFVNEVDKLKFEMEKSLKELENNFNSLMQKAFRGELFN
ncbi:restriction endonuclease subunit S [Clostridium cochlearium]|uniref:restriction endonuclease subunit S n=1 Tax=Clostridium cochlearium TaxID=1494 RepID=UPI000B948795|nr:restriction endonuclease subunit S [Clostridium cochlearium]SNV87673.1 type I restriction-modification system subunit S [Clostridium cochlearium]STA93519.1 type I restriction-modification system subunit S [Clostridium cochlearium]